MFEYTQEEKQVALEKYFKNDEGLVLLNFPKKQKQKYLCLLWISELIQPKIEYSEKQINEIITEVNPDYVTIRRYLVDFGLLYREADGSKYWK